MTLNEFCRAHGGKQGHMVDLSDKFGFTSIKTVDNQCFLAFAKTQFGEDLSLAKVKKLLKEEELDVLEGTSEQGNPCFTIVKHTELYEAFDF